SWRLFSSGSSRWQAASAPSGSGCRQSLTCRSWPRSRPRVSPSSSVVAKALPVIAGGAFAGIAFAAKGGTELTRTTITEVVIVVVSGCIVAAAFLWGRRSASYGMTTLLLFTLLAFLTAVSVLWSITPELTYVEAGRTFAYLAVFGAAVAVGRLAPKAAPALLIAILIGAVVPVAYGLASRIWPAALAEN